jgi:hypothetical protein
MNMLTARTVTLVLGFLLLVGCVPEDTKPRNQGEDQVGIEVWACAPTGLSPEKEWFE